MSSGHSCKEGRTISNSHSRWYRSSLNRFSCIASWRSSLVAATILTLARFSLLPPIGMYVPSCKTRSSMAWTSRDKIPISSRKSVPPFATSKYPSLLASAPVNVPFMCPKKRVGASSLGMTPQFTATNGISFRSPI